ncbi:dolichyl-phosphate beta-glucosyltransferase [Rhabdaerophilaceae bacterium]
MGYRVSLAAPAYNEGEGIADVVAVWDGYLAKNARLDDYEIVVCNDGSKDKTGAILDELVSRFPKLKPVHFTVNQGAAAALTNAIANTTMDWVLLIDSDGQFPIENLDRALDAVEQQAARAVIGIRAKKQDSLFARFGTWSSAVICNVMFGVKLKDFNSAFKLIQGSLVRALVLEAKGLNYSTEVTAKVLERQVPFVEIDISHRAREKGQSSMKLFRGAAHRLLFVIYLGLRQILFRFSILQRPKNGI